jgi:hypothetical protein
MLGIVIEHLCLRGDRITRLAVPIAVAIELRKVRR